MRPTDNRPHPPIHIPHIKDFDAPYGICEQISPSVRRILAKNPSSFTHKGTSTYLVGIGPDTCVIDPGPDLVSHMTALQTTLVDCQTPRYLITHTHRDHSSATLPLQEKIGGLSYGFGPHGTSKQISTAEEDIDYDFTPDHTLKDGDSISGDGWSLIAVHTPGHTSNHLCFYMPEEKILFSGDHIMAWATSIISPPDGHMGLYISSLQRILGMDIKTIWPTHGAALTNPHAYVQALIDHRYYREHQILDLLKDGPLWIEDFVNHLYADLPRLMHPAATRSVFAHLLHLTETGVITTDGPAREDSHYRRIG